MPVFQFKCSRCSALLEYLVTKNNSIKPSCLMCKSTELIRTTNGSFYPNKNFCPKESNFDNRKEKLDLSLLQNKKDNCFDICN